MRLEYFINEMLERIDFAIINTYLVNGKRERRKKTK